jgi:hypothetical protein
MINPLAVVEAFNAASNAGDLDRMLEFFADDAVLTTLPPPAELAHSIFAGKVQIRAWFAPQMQHLHIAPRNLRANGTTVGWEATIASDMFRQLGIDSFEVRAEAVVENGQMTALTVTQTPESVAKFARVTDQGHTDSADPTA